MRNHFQHGIKGGYYLGDTQHGSPKRSVATNASPADYQAGVHAPIEREKADDIAYAARWHLELLLEMAES